MKRAIPKRIKQIEEGDFIYLKGLYATAKWEVIKVQEGKAHMKMVNESKEYIHPELSFEIGKPLFKKGLRAFPYSTLLERDWKAFQAKKEMMALFNSMERIGRKLPNMQNSSRVLHCKSIIERFLIEMKEALRKKNDAWKEYRDKN
jgi:hypothetical protein